MENEKDGNVGSRRDEEVIRPPSDRDWAGWVRAEARPLEAAVRKVRGMGGSSAIRPRVRVMLDARSYGSGRHHASLTLDVSDEHHAVASLIARLPGHLQQFPSPYGGELLVVFVTAADHRVILPVRFAVEIATERSSEDPDVRWTMAYLRERLRETQRESVESRRAMLLMFAASSDVIRATGDVVAATRGQFQGAPPPEVREADGLLAQFTQMLRVALENARAAQAPAQDTQAPPDERAPDDGYDDIRFDSFGGYTNA